MMATRLRAKISQKQKRAYAEKLALEQAIVADANDAWGDFDADPTIFAFTDDLLAAFGFGDVEGGDWTQNLRGRSIFDDEENWQYDA
jgi:hypothetical protein